MPDRPGRPDRPTRDVVVRPLGAATGATTGGPNAPRLTVSTLTASEAAHGTLREALLDVRAAERDAAAREAWQETSPHDAPFETPSGAPPQAPDAAGATWDPDARRVGGDRGAARDRVNAAVTAYARALRRDGVDLPAALGAVRATLTRDTSLLPPDACAAMQHDAARCCLEAYYAH